MLCSNRARQPIVSSGGTVCAYVPVGAEPGSIEMLDVLLRAVAAGCCCRWRAPRADDMPLPLRWGEYRPGDLVAARWGLLEPPEPWLPASALAEADLVLVPGAGGRPPAACGWAAVAGFYDRSLALAGTASASGRGGPRRRSLSTSCRPSRTTCR